MRSRWRQVLEVLGPSTCAVCGRWPTAALCAACEARFAPHRTRCTACACPLPDPGARCPHCIGGPSSNGVGTCIVAVDYAYPWDRLISRFKFKGEVGWARVFARLMIEAPGALALLQRADCIVPIPLSAARLAERGHHPPWELAKALGRLHPAPARPDVLVRWSDTAEQHRLGRIERLRNLKGALGVHPLRSAQLRSRHVVLIDDVTTTGATLQAAAQALCAAGAQSVGALVFARTPSPNTPTP